MKLSYLIKKGIDHLIEHGDGDISINLLTEDEYNFFNIKNVSVVDCIGSFEIEIDIETKNYK